MTPFRMVSSKKSQLLGSVTNTVLASLTERPTVYCTRFSSGARKEINSSLLFCLRKLCSSINWGQWDSSSFHTCSLAGIRTLPTLSDLLCDSILVCIKGTQYPLISDYVFTHTAKGHFPVLIFYPENLHFDCELIYDLYV